MAHKAALSKLQYKYTPGEYQRNILFFKKIDSTSKQGSFSKTEQGFVLFLKHLLKESNKVHGT